MEMIGEGSMFVYATFIFVAEWTLSGLKANSILEKINTVKAK